MRRNDKCTMVGGQKTPLRHRRIRDSASRRDCILGMGAWMRKSWTGVRIMQPGMLLSSLGPWGLENRLQMLLPLPVQQ